MGRRIFVYCADPRNEANLADKIDQKLLSQDEARPVRISILGGPICLAHPKDLHEEVSCLLKQMRFALKTFGDITEIVLVGHDCGYYANVSTLVNGDGKKEDLTMATYFLKRHVHRVKISAYYDVSTAKEISFEEIVTDEVLV